MISGSLCVAWRARRSIFVLSDTTDLDVIPSVFDLALGGDELVNRILVEEQQQKSNKK